MLLFFKRIILLVFLNQKLTFILKHLMYFFTPNLKSNSLILLIF